MDQELAIAALGDDRLHPLGRLALQRAAWGDHGDALHSNVSSEVRSAVLPRAADQNAASEGDSHADRERHPADQEDERQHAQAFAAEAAAEQHRQRAKAARAGNQDADCNHDSTEDFFHALPPGARWRASTSAPSAPSR